MTMEPRSDFLREMTWRGFIHQCTDLKALDARMADGPVTAYVGYDATADSLHVGHLVSIMLLRWLQKTGHKPVVLMGGGTTKVGDPSGKDESRRLLSEQDIAANIASIRRTFDRFLNFDDTSNGAILVNNADWLDSLGYISFLRDVGPHFTINRMLTFDSVKLRLEREQPLTFLEFNYMILQAYDFLELSERHGCRLQMGGSDQWGNIVNGIELARRRSGVELFGLTTPLLTTASGAKMGKTATGAVWLNEDRLSAYDYWQYWRNTDDADVGRFLRLFTDLPQDEIRRLEKLKNADINEAKKILANEATAMCRGQETVKQVEATAQSVFEQGGTGVTDAGSGSQLPSTDVSREQLNKGIPVYELFRQTGLTTSNGEARRLIKGGGARVNDVAIRDDSHSVGLADLSSEGVIKLSAGKKRHALVRVRD